MPWRRWTRSGGRGHVLIVDASCLYLVAPDGLGADAVRRVLLDDSEYAAPHVIDVEVLGVIQRDHRLGRLDATAAGQAVEDLRSWPGERYGHQPPTRKGVAASRQCPGVGRDVCSSGRSASCPVADPGPPFGVCRRARLPDRGRRNVTCVN